MLIVCPACASEYRIDAERVGTAGRSVRCANCRETWFISAEEVTTALFEEMATGAGDPTPPASDPGPTQAPTPPPTVDAPPEESPRRRRPPPAGKGKQARPAWARRLSPPLVAGLVAALLLPLALIGRAGVVRAIPQTASIFSVLGLPVNLRGIELKDISAFQIAAQGGNPAQLVVEGDLVGIAQNRVPVPPIEVEVRDTLGQALYRWSIAAPRSGLELNERARFKGTFSSPLEKGRQVEVHFGDLAAATETSDAGKP